jgi:hypothetical protein
MDYADFSRPNQLQLARSDIAFDRECAIEQRQREAEAEARMERAQQRAQQHFMEFGEWPAETAMRQQALAELRERQEASRARAARAEQQQAMEARWLAEGRTPRSVQEILQIAACFP